MRKLRPRQVIKFINKAKAIRRRLDAERHALMLIRDSIEFNIGGSLKRSLEEIPIDELEAYLNQFLEINEDLVVKEDLA